MTTKRKPKTPTQPKRPALESRANEAREIIDGLMALGMSMEQIASGARASLRSVYRWHRENRAPHPIWLESLRRMHEAPARTGD
jgi:DNA invertase Pin-like site-specific DNA recombinase